VARRKSAAGIEGLWSIRPDETMRLAVEQDLAAMRRISPKATRTDVVRAWGLMANRTRRVKALAEWQEKAKAMAQHAQAASSEADSLRKQMAAYEAQEEAQRSKALTAALRALRAPQNHVLRKHLADLVVIEQANKPASTANPSLARARRELGSFRAIQDLLGAT
jgi:hypothetical protein